MDLHRYYLHMSAIDISIVELLKSAFRNDSFLFLHHIVKYYNAEIIKSNLSAQQLDTFRTILCCEYQFIFNSEQRRNRTIPNDLCFKTIQNAVAVEKQTYDVIKYPVIYDIIILQLTLYCNSQCIKQHLLNFQKSNNYIMHGNESERVYIRTLECFIESLQLRQFLYNDLDVDQLKDFNLICLEELILWLRTKENIEWQLYASMCLKLINTFDTEIVLPVVWNCILNEMNDLKDILCAMSILIDVCFSLKMGNTNFMYDTLCCMPKLWLIIIQGLKSPIQQYRKQGLFIMTRITDYTCNINDCTVKVSNGTGIIPFMCNQSVNTKISINSIRESYFLILEALEEKQHRLILPALARLPILTKGSREHSTCNNCFSYIWLRLVFERMLRHESNTILKQAIVHVCEHPALVYDLEFLKVFVHALNTMSLYECQGYEKEPKILNDITALFIVIMQERKQTDFFKGIFQVMNDESWAPVPIFYTMKALADAVNRTSYHFEDDYLVLAKSLVQTNLNMHSQILRIATQIELLKIISVSVEKVNNLKIAVDMLLELPLGEIFVRNSYSWNIITLWLKKVLVKRQTIDFIRSVCEECLCSNTGITLINAAKFAHIVALFYDAGLILQHKECLSYWILNNWLSLLKGIDLRPYANGTHVFYMVEFMSHLISLKDIETNKNILDLISLYSTDAIKILLKNSRSIPYKYSYEETNRYLAAIAIYFTNGKLVLQERELLHYANLFRNESITTFENIGQYTNMHYVCALQILYSTQNILFMDHPRFYIEPLLSICDTHLTDNEAEDLKSKGRIASDAYILLTRLTNQYLSTVEMKLWHRHVDWLRSVQHLYEKGGNEIVPEVALVLKTIVNKGVLKESKHRSMFESIFDTLWRATFLSTKNKTYFSAVKNLLGVILNNNFLTLPNVMQFINKFIDQLLEESKNVQKLSKLLVDEIQSLNVCHKKNLCEPLLLCFLHGYLLRKDKQIEAQSFMYIAKQYQNCYSNLIQVIEYNNDANIRATSVIVLHQTINEDKEYATLLLPIVLRKLEIYQNKRYFNHSYIHKIKHRIMQILLILQPVLNKEDTIALQEFLCNMILLESNQHSVRIMQEWLLVKVFGENEELHDNLWNFFEKGMANRPGCVSSIICIIYHISKIWAKNYKYEYNITAIKYIARCCLGQQYNIRLYSQIIFAKLYNMLQITHSDQALLEYKGLYEAVVVSLKDGLAKNSKKIQEDFYFSTFHATRDYSLQTIYFELPRLTDMDFNEWLTPEVFRILNFKEISDHPLRLYNSDTTLSDIQISSYLNKSLGQTNLSLETYNAHTDELENIPKKIIPSMSLSLQYSDTFATINKSISDGEKLSKDGLIVVASLLNRIPNLGGLARTCEIFNVTELVIGNLNHVKEKEFQNLSVSAENWITMTEVKPHELCKYLLNKKELGWSLIGIEQTTNSINLRNVKFEKKTIFVLGNEKDGIPANLIPIFDACVQIPQVGVIRSLNVHVSGAICIWQYAMQHILN